MKRTWRWWRSQRPRSNVLPFQMRIVIGQINVAVGDIEGNVRRIRDAVTRAAALRARVIVFPELAIPGYPPEDLLFKPSFIEANLRALRDVAAMARDPEVVVGFVDRGTDGKLRNAAAVARGGRVVARYHKMRLPNYGVFDEPRYFVPGTKPLVTLVGGARAGISICEDIWCDDGPLGRETQAGARWHINLSASPYHAGKLRTREQLLIRRARQD